VLLAYVERADTVFQVFVVQSPNSAVRRNRKMCFVVQNHLGKGAAARPRCIPQALAPSGHKTHSRASRPYRRSNTRRRFHSPCTHRPRSDHTLGTPTNRAPFGYRHFMETTSSRPGKGAFALPFPWTHPIDQGAFVPLGTLTNPTRIGCRHLIEDGSRPRLPLPWMNASVSTLSRVPAPLEFQQNALAGSAA
jgi:hypothetical protein